MLLSLELHFLSIFVIEMPKSVVSTLDFAGEHIWEDVIVLDCWERWLRWYLAHRLMFLSDSYIMKCLMCKKHSLIIYNLLEKLYGDNFFICRLWGRTVEALSPFFASCILLGRRLSDALGKVEDMPCTADWLGYSHAVSDLYWGLDVLGRVSSSVALRWLSIASSTTVSRSVVFVREWIQVGWISLGWRIGADLRLRDCMGSE
jgi:hypothetical protein